LHCLKPQLTRYTLKYTLKHSHSFTKLECLRLLCHTTCFGHTLDHFQWMFLVQCCCPPCCFVTILLECVAVICVLLSCVPFCCRSCSVHNKTNSREVHMTTTQIENTATYSSRILTKQQVREKHCKRNIPWRRSSVWAKRVGWHNRRSHSNVLKEWLFF
jgi:hypothetical protein